MLELLRFTYVLHRLLDLPHLQLDGLITRVNLHFEVLNLLYEFQDLLILVLQVDIQLYDNVLQPMLLVYELLRRRGPGVI